jgi:hypothetical protein
MKMQISEAKSSPIKCELKFKNLMIKKSPWPEFASELYQLSDCRLLTKLVPTFVDRGCHVVTVTDQYK